MTACAATYWATSGNACEYVEGKSVISLCHFTRRWIKSNEEVCFYLNFWKYKKIIKKKKNEYESK